MQEVIPIKEADFIQILLGKFFCLGVYSGRGGGERNGTPIKVIDLTDQLSLSIATYVRIDLGLGLFIS